MDAPLAWPAPFASAKGQLLILPVNEGISYPDGRCVPARDAATTSTAATGSACRGTGRSTATRAGWRSSRRRTTRPSASRGATACSASSPSGSRRSSASGRSASSATSSWTAAATSPWPSATGSTRSRRGCLKTLAEKRKAVPAVDLLVGAVNVWCWDRDAAALVPRDAGLRHRAHPVEQRQPPDHLKALNDLGVLTSRYDIYQDAMDPANFPRLRWHASRLDQRRLDERRPDDRRGRRLGARLGGRDQGRRR